MRGEQDQVSMVGTPDGGSTDPARLRVEVAELRKLLEAARTGEAEWRQLIETMPQIVWITRPDGGHTYFNGKWLEFTGLTLQESVGFGWNAPFHPDDREQAAHRWEQATSTGSRTRSSTAFVAQTPPTNGCWATRCRYAIRGVGS